VEVGPLWGPDLEPCADCFEASWPTITEVENGQDPVPGELVVELATAAAASELLAIRAFVPVPRSVGCWWRLDIRRARDADMIIPQRAQCSSCGGGLLGCDVTTAPSAGRFEEQYNSTPPAYVTPRSTDDQMQRAAQAIEWTAHTREVLRSDGGDFVAETRRPWHSGALDGSGAHLAFLEAAESDFDRVELACSLAVGLLNRRGSEGWRRRRSAPSGGDIREYMILGAEVRDGDGRDPANRGAPRLWFDDEACRFRRLDAGADEPPGGNPDEGATAIAERHEFMLTIATDPSPLVHKYALHGLRLAHLDVGAAAYCLLTALEWAGFRECRVEEPGDWNAWIGATGLNADVWRLGTAVLVR
jgi:hypothetical protein